MFNVMFETSSISSSTRRHTMGWSTNFSSKAWLCIPKITLNFHVSSVIQYLRNLNRHSHFFDPASSRFNFLIIIWYVPLLSHIIVTNVCFLSEPLSDLPITTPNPNFPTFLRTHCIICSRTKNTSLFINYARTSTFTTIGQAPELTSSG